MQNRCGVAFIALMTTTTALAEGNAKAGQEAYEARCGGCHAIEANRVGPAHRGVVGRKAGGVNNYDYSSALRKSRIVWSEKTLDLWLTDPEKLIPGQKMGYSLGDKVARADIIAYLKAQK